MLAILLAALSPAEAQERYPTSQGIMNAREFAETVCTFAAWQPVEGEGPRGPRYAYQSALFMAAGVDAERDDAETTRSKMQAWWLRHQHILTCNLLNSTVNGHILKLAVDRSANEFINDAVRRWRVDLNFVDKNGGTVLDFIDEELVRMKGTPREAIVRRYQTLFESNGARRARDLGRDDAR